MAGRTDVLVLGSANLDVVLRVSALPRPGETVLALGRETAAGGKGANQAVAAARSGARTAFLGAVGDDAGGAVLRASLSAAGVDLSALRVGPSATGSAYVMVDERGENAIVVEAGANAGLVDLEGAELAAVAGAGVLLCQLEVPLATVTAAVRHARSAGVRTVLNAAPARALPDGLLAALDLLVVNEQEAAVVAQRDPELERRVPEVVVTLGAEGALVRVRGQAPVRVPGVPARKVVDTTGAGDVFCGALVAAQARGLPLLEAVAYGCAAASRSVERPGAT